MNERLEAIVSGRVQMVMYRDFVQRKARALKLVGFVRNMPDKTVHVVAEGSHAVLETLEKKLHNGSLLSNVAKVKSTFLPGTGEYSSFSISYE